VFFRNFF